MYIAMDEDRHAGGGIAGPPFSSVGFNLPCIYGRWCGPKCSGPGAPIDDVDACCKAHDECYARRGYFSCDCNQQLLDCVAPKRNIRDKKGRAAWAVWTAFRRLPCRRV